MSVELESTSDKIKIISVSLVLTDLYCSYAEFINNGGRVVVCGVCLGIAGYEAIDTINGTINATPEVTSKCPSQYYCN